MFDNFLLTPPVHVFCCEPSDWNWKAAPSAKLLLGLCFLGLKRYPSFNRSMNIWNRPAWTVDKIPSQAPLLLLLRLLCWFYFIFSCSCLLVFFWAECSKNRSDLNHRGGNGLAASRWPYERGWKGQKNRCCHCSWHTRCYPVPANDIVSFYRVIASASPLNVSHVPIRKHLSCSSHDAVVLRKRLDVNIFLFFLWFGVFGPGLPAGCQRLLPVHQLPERPVAVPLNCTVNLMHCAIKHICSLASDTVACCSFLVKRVF